MADRTIKGKDDPDAIAAITAQDWVNRWQANVRAIAEDLTPDEIRQADEDLFVNALHRYAESGDERVAQEAVNTAFRAGRSAGLKDMQGDVLATLQGKVDDGEIDAGDNRHIGLDRLVWRRSAVGEGISCDSCLALDGTVISGPDADLTKAHEGPPATCLCLPYADLNEISNQ